MKLLVKYTLLLFILFCSCKNYQIRKTVTSNESTLTVVDLEGRYSAVFDKLTTNEDTLYHLDGFYFETSKHKLPLLILSRHVTDICSDIDLIPSIRIVENRLHPKMFPGEILENFNTYENESQVIVSFKVKEKGVQVSKICDQFYTTYNASSCNDIDKEDVFLVFTSIESSRPLTKEEITDKGLRPLNKKGFEFGTCH